MRKRRGPREEDRGRTACGEKADQAKRVDQNSGDDQEPSGEPDGWVKPEPAGQEVCDDYGHEGGEDQASQPEHLLAPVYMTQVGAT